MTCKNLQVVTLSWISTHTLTWSVTYSGFATGTNYQISTHTLTWSVTQRTNGKTYSVCISTHTLTWSVTYSGFATGTNYQISTHTLTWSVTVSIPMTGNDSAFQLTRSRGA